ncbi:MAG TPA: hypothetical protein VGX16_02495 [Solirubrobacteraceae bacterium]|nr:hypothetical protein [Solirubrobacteraceae bacterium]
MTRVSMIARRWLSGVTLAMLALCAVPSISVSPAAAAVTEYSLSVVEGVTTLPEHSVAHVSGGVEPGAPVAISIIHNGTVVARASSSRWNAWLSQVPQVGDTVTLESPIGNVVGSMVYDGLPTIDPTVCAGSASFSGQRSGGDTVEGEFYLLVPHPEYTATRGRSMAQVTVLNGPTFAGNFLTPLMAGETVTATETLLTPLAGGARFTYTSEIVRPVGACPLPPVPPVQVYTPPPLVGSILKIVRATIQKALSSGLLDEVSINQGGTVMQDLFLQGGSLPAFASRRSKHHAKPALLLARGSAVAGTSGGKVRVRLRLTRRGRSVLAHSHTVHAVLVTTLVGSKGAKLSLGRRSITLHR